MNWEVEITGDKSDLEDLSIALNADDLSIIRKEDKFFLKSKNLDSLSDFEDVKGKVTALLNSINAGTKLALNSRKLIKYNAICQLDENGKTINTFIESIININTGIRIKTSFELSSSDGKIVYNQATPIAVWMKIAEKDENVNSVFDLINYDFNSWSTLYKIVEILQKDQFKPILKNGAYKNKVDILQHTANSVLAIGNEARHYRESYGIPKVPMQFSEAKSLIKVIIYEWLREKEQIYLDKTDK